jgi:hypothetical protein
LCRQNEGSRATGDSFGADEFSDGHAIVIRHSSLPLRGSAADAVFWSNRCSRTAERFSRPPVRLTPQPASVRGVVILPSVNRHGFWRTYCCEPASRLFSGSVSPSRPEGITRIIPSHPSAIPQRWRPNCPIWSSPGSRRPRQLRMRCNHGMVANRHRDLADFVHCV